MSEQMDILGAIEQIEIRDQKIKSLKAALAEVMQFAAQCHEPSCAVIKFQKLCDCGAQKAWDMAEGALR